VNLSLGNKRMERRREIKEEEKKDVGVKLASFGKSFAGVEGYVASWPPAKALKSKGYISGSLIIRGIGTEFSSQDYWPLEQGREIAFSTGVSTRDELTGLGNLVGDLSLEVESVKTELMECKEGINTIIEELREKPLIKQTELFEIDETLEVIKPIPVVIEEYNDEVIAAFPEIEAFGVGSGEAEAIRNLKEEIREIFFELENISEDELGKLPLSWKRVLLKVVKNIGNAK